MKNEYQRRIDVRGVAASGVAGQTVVYAGGGGNADQVDGIDADRVPRPGCLLALNENSQYPSSVFPTPRGDSLMGWGGRTIFGPHVTHLVEPIDAAQTTIYVREPLLEVGEFLLFQPPIGSAEKMKVLTGPFFLAAFRYSYTVIRNVDGLGAKSFLADQAVVSIAKSGQGYIAIDAQAGQSYRPFLDVLERTADSVGAVSIRVRLGQLDGLAANYPGDPTIQKLQPSGWGLYADNVFLRGRLHVLGNSRIEGELAVGLPGSPELRIRRWQLPSGAWMHGEQWFYQPGRSWWSLLFNENTGKVFWQVKSPATGPGIVNPELEEPLITLMYRQGLNAKGEAQGKMAYYLDIAAKVIIGELNVNRLTLSGEWAQINAQMGEMQGGALRLAGQAYNSGQRSGLYAWNLQPASPWWSTYAPPNHSGVTRGFEFWRYTAATGEIRQGYWDYPNGRFVWGTNNDAWMNADGLTMAANVVDDIASIPSPATLRRGVTWYNADRATYDSILSQVTYNVVGGTAGWSRSSYLTADIGDGLNDFAEVGLGFHSIAGGYIQHNMFLLLTRSNAGGVNLTASGFEGVYLPGLYFTQAQGLSWWQMNTNYGLDLGLGAFKPPATLDGLDAGQFGAGLNTTYAVAAAIGLDRSGTTKVYQIGVDDQTDPGNPRLAVKVSGTWYYAALTTELPMP